MSYYQGSVVLQAGMLQERLQLKASREPVRAIQGDTWTAELLPRSAYSASYVTTSEVVGFAFDRQSGSHSFSSDKTVSFVAEPNGLAAIPVGCEVRSESSHGGEYLRLTFEFDPCYENAIDRQFSNLIDRESINTAHRIRKAILGNCAADIQALEEWVGSLRGLAASMTRPEFRPKGHARWLTPYRRRRLDQVINEDIGGDLTVDRLATEVGVSGSFLSRSFRAAMGKSLYDYVIDRRVSHARSSVVSSKDKLSEIAIANGFSSHAHLTTTFKSRLGLSPAKLRRSVT